MVITHGSYESLKSHLPASFQPTYEELKQRFLLKTVADFFESFQPTYEELKPGVLDFGDILIKFPAYL